MYNICVDIGGYHIAIAVVNNKHEIVEKKSFLYPKSSAKVKKSCDENTNLILNLIKQVISEYSKMYKISKIYFSVPGDTKNGYFYGNNKDYLSCIDFATEFKNYKVQVVNDCIAVGYYILNRYSPKEKTLVTTIGSGTGFCVVDEGKVLDSYNSHLKTFNKLKHNKRYLTSLKRLVIDYNKKTNRRIRRYTIFKLIEENDSIAINLFNNYIDSLIFGAKKFSEEFGFKKIYLGGGLIEHKELFEGKLGDLIEIIDVKNDAALLGMTYL